MSTSDNVCLRAVFRSLAGEAEELARLGAKLEYAISVVPEYDGEAMQSVDRMLQYAGSLRELCMHLSDGLQGETRISAAHALRNIRLDEVSNRVRNSLGIGGLRVVGPAGDLDLF